MDQEIIKIYWRNCDQMEDIEIKDKFMTMDLKDKHLLPAEGTIIC